MFSGFAMTADEKWPVPNLYRLHLTNRTIEHSVDVLFSLTNKVGRDYYRL